MSDQKLRLLVKLMESPTRFTDVVAYLRVSKKRAADHLNELEASQQIRKNQQTGLYEITDMGRQLLEIESAKGLVEKVLTDNGLSDEEKIKALSEGVSSILMEKRSKQLQTHLHDLRKFILAEPEGAPRLTWFFRQALSHLYTFKGSATLLNLYELLGTIANMNEKEFAQMYSNRGVPKTLISEMVWTMRETSFSKDDLTVISNNIARFVTPQASDV